MKKSLYDKYYLNEHCFGSPCPELIKFFDEYQHKGTVLDLGCGQGRDAIPLGKIGYRVIGVDISGVGIEQLNQDAKSLRLGVLGVEGNLYEYAVDSFIDIVLMDSILHFYKGDKEKEIGLFIRLMNEIKVGGLICNVMLNGHQRVNLIKKTILESEHSFEVIEERLIDCPDIKAEYHMMVIKKTK